MKKTAIGLVLGLIIGAAGLALYLKNEISIIPEPAFHEHADIAVYLNGEKFDFSLDQYKSVTPCKVVDSGLPFIDVALAHGGLEAGDAIDLHDNIGTTVHLHEAGIAWHDFFESIQMEFADNFFVDDQGNRYEEDEERSFRLFVNNEEVETLADREIRDLDRVLISYGLIDRSDEEIALELTSITDDACYYSETCSHRGLPAYEACGVGGAEKSSFLEYLDL